MSTRAIGEVGITPVLEVEGPIFAPSRVYPDWTEAAVAPHMGWMVPRDYDPGSAMLMMTIQSHVLRTPHHTILVDACIGNHKERASPLMNRRDTPWLDRLEAAGVAPEDIDIVMCSHLHPDHVGWNTRLADGRWVPTFPNARYVFAEAEYAHWRARSTEAELPHFFDSVLPIVEAGQAQMVALDHAIDDAARLEPLLGHTPGHVGLHLASGGREAVFTGDMMHHPIQIAMPDWSTNFCSDPDEARATRRAFLETYADSGVLVVPAHFAAPTWGFVESAGDGFRWRYDE